MMAWRWLKVPRPESCPDRRTRTPSRPSEPNATSSAKAQSIGASPSPIFARRASWLTIFGLMLKPSGTTAILRAMSRTTSAATGVSTTAEPSSSSTAGGSASRAGFCLAISLARASVAS